MPWSDPVDLYCERSDPSFWAEPINALANLGFLLAAAAALVQWRKKGADDLPALGLILVLGLVGIGSFLFHTFATRGAVLADVIPIALFVFGYLFLALRRFLHLSLGVSVAILVAFIGLSQGLTFGLPAGALNGSGEYLPPLAALIAIGLLVEDEARRRGLLLAATIFAISLTFRTLDLAVCAAIPVGTHFIWHVLNAWVLYRLVGVAMQPRETLGKR